jgi:hypothetical protein
MHPGFSSTSAGGYRCRQADLLKVKSDDSQKSDKDTTTEDDLSDAAKQENSTDTKALSKRDQQCQLQFGIRQVVGHRKRQHQPGSADAALAALQRRRRNIYPVAEYQMLCTEFTKRLSWPTDFHCGGG